MEISLLSDDWLQSVACERGKQFNLPPWNNDWTDQTSLSDLQDRSSASGFYGLVAHEGEKIVGALWGSVRRYGSRRSLYLDEFFVVADAQGQGVASKLWEVMKDQLKAQGVGGVFFTTLKDSAAHHFYEKQGCFALDDSLVMWGTF